MMRTENVKPDATTYQNIIAHYTNFANIAMCLRTLYDMDVAGITPTIQTAEMIINTAIQSKLPRLALDYAVMFELTSPRRLEGRVWLSILSKSADVLFVRFVSRLTVVPNC